MRLFQSHVYVFIHSLMPLHFSHELSGKHDQTCNKMRFYGFVSLCNALYYTEGMAGGDAMMWYTQSIFVMLDGRKFFLFPKCHGFVTTMLRVRDDPKSDAAGS